MDIKDILNGTTANLWHQRFIIARNRKAVPGAFVNIIAKDEITVIINETNAPKELIDADYGWKIISLDVQIPMETVGITAAIASACAQEKIAIMPIAAFSRDHFLVKETDVFSAVKALKTLGITLTG